MLGALARARRRAIALPIDYHVLLGVPPGADDGEIKGAYEQLVDAAQAAENKTVGFSEEALAFRAALLKQAKDTLLDDELRDAYEAALATRREEREQGDAATVAAAASQVRLAPPVDSPGVLLDVAWDDVPGALCALQEVGCMDEVQMHGRAFLYGAPGVEPATLRHPGRRDAALALALVYCERSRDALQASPPRVADGCRKLEQALRVLQEEGGDELAPELQVQVYELLNRNLVRYVLELLALPLGPAHVRERHEGLRSLRRVVWGDAGDGGSLAGADPAAPSARLVDFLRSAARHLTSYELMALFGEASETRPLPRELSVTFARAYLARGWVDRRPSLIREAMELCAVGEADENGAALGWSTAALLLGRAEDAVVRLQNTRDTSVRRVLRHADIRGEGDEGALQAVCAICQGHIARDVLPAFRDTAHAVAAMSPGQVAAEENGAARGDETDGDEVSRDKAAWRPELEPAEVDDRLPASGVAPPASLDDWFADPHVRWACNREEDVVVPFFARIGRMLGDSVSMPRAAYRAWMSGPDEAAQQYIAAGTPAPPQAGEDVAAGTAAVAPDVPSPGSDQRARRAGQAMIVVGATVLVTLKLDLIGRAMRFAAEVTRQPGTGAAGAWRSPETSANAARATKAVKDAAATGTAAKGDAAPAAPAGKQTKAAKPGLTKMQAHEVIEMWQKIKNEALGPKHSIAKLDEILDGPMKEHWRARARHVRNMGWRWDYSLLSLTIEGVELNARGDRAVVLASIDESAVLREGGAPKAQDLGDEERADSYNSSYQVRYELVKNDKPSKLGLGWKISGGRVLY